MTLKQILEHVKTIPPRGHIHRQTFNYRNISFVKLGEGGSRVAYAIVGTPWIVKFGESKREVEAILALRSNPTIRRYLPGLIWANNDCNVVIMVRYTVKDFYSDEQEKLSTEARQIFNGLEDAIPDWMFGDLHQGNVGVDAKGRIKVIDCGNFYH